MVPVVTSHPWKSQLRDGFASRIFTKRVGVDWTLVRAASTTKAYFIIAGWHELSTQISIIILALRGQAFALLTDTPRKGWSSRNGIISVLRFVFLRMAFWRAHRVFGTGAVALERLKALGCSGRKLANLPFVVDLESFAPGPRQLARLRDEMVFISVGRLVNRLKGHDLAIKALSIVRQNRPELRIRYRIAGTGPDAAKLTELANESGIDLELCPWLEPSEVPTFYRSGDIYLHPSRYDPYPVAVLEAMASGLAVIGSNDCGVVIDRIEHGLNGIRYETADIATLAEQILRLCDNVGQVAALGLAARRTAEEWPATRAVEIVKDAARKAAECY
jgi:glycosyltransferase involved in cell wall biosynthesis